MSDRDAFFKYLTEMGTLNKPFLGKIIAIEPLGQDTEMNFTLPKGKGSGMWYGLMSWLGNKGYEVVKIEETLDVSAVDQGYYALTQRNKDELEGKIKQGLASVAQSVADYELISHDWRKYEGFLRMLEMGDEHSLRATFIDEVDISTGNNAIKTAIARWPTMIVDFMKLGREMPTQTDVDKISEGLKISKAEAVLLSTKQRLYIDWKDRFGSEVKNRCERILALKNSREMTINEYREWLKPIVAKHKMYQEGLSKDPTGVAFSAFSSPGQAVSSNNIEIWAWQPILGIYGRTGTTEMVDGGFTIDPYDDFIKENIIFAEKSSVGDYPTLKKMHVWINRDWADKNAKKVEGKMKKEELYYAFLRMKYERAIIRNIDGSEMEDLTFYPKMYFLSQNALLVLLLHYQALQKEFGDYIDKLIGFSSSEGKNPQMELDEIVKKWKGEDKKEDKKKKSFSLDPLKKDASESWKKINKVFNFNFTFSRMGPYEHNFADRIATPYLATEGTDFWNVLKKNLMDGAGVGK